MFVLGIKLTFLFVVCVLFPLGMAWHLDNR
jgi:hypothetical protein